MITIYSKLYSIILLKPLFKCADVLDERSGMFQEEKGINKSVGILDRIGMSSTVSADVEVCLPWWTQFGLHV